jgi:predicted metallopeptidase
MKYEFALDLQKISDEISRLLFPHVKIGKVKCFRSHGSSSRNTIARCHTIGKLMQKAIGVDAHYALEFLSERFDKLSEEEQVKTIIHELMHIPKTFGGGFRQHDFVCDKNVNTCYINYKKNKKESKDDFFEIEKLKMKNKNNWSNLEDMKNEKKNFFKF